MGFRVSFRSLTLFASAISFYVTVTRFLDSGTVSPPISLLPLFPRILRSRYDELPSRSPSPRTIFLVSASRIVSVSVPASTFSYPPLAPLSLVFRSNLCYELDSSRFNCEINRLYLLERDVGRFALGKHCYIFESRNF